jgi:hypothetical protein
VTSPTPRFPVAAPPQPGLRVGQRQLDAPASSSRAARARPPARAPGRRGWAATARP